MSQLTSQSKKNGVLIHLSSATIFKVSATVIGIILFYLLRDVVLIFLTSLLLATLIDPFAHWLQERKIKRGIAVLIVYLVFAAILTLVSILIVPTIVNQARQLFDRYVPVEVLNEHVPILGSLLEGEFAGADFVSIFETIQRAGIVDAFPQISSFVTSAFGAVITLFIILILAFYMVVEEAAMRKGLLMITPRAHRDFVEDLVPKIREKIGLWLRGQLILMFLVFLMTYIILEFILNIPYALVLALTAGVLEIIPFVGPMLSSIPAILIGFTVSPVHGFLTMLSYFGIQQVEGEILTPKIMQRVTGLSPIVTIIAVLVGHGLGGVVGAIVAIPLAVVLSVIVIEGEKIISKMSE